MITLKKETLKSGFAPVFCILRIAGLLLLVIILILNASLIFSAAPLCNPTAAMLCAAVDDTADIYINGTLIGTFPYCDKSNSCTPLCIALTAGQMALLLDSGNKIAVQAQNTATDELWASWSLDITCATGHVVVTGDNPQAGHPVTMLHDAACTSPNPSPTPSGGKQWYDPLYVPNAAWVAPVEMTGQKWGKRIYDPGTGTLLHALSFASSYASTGCGALWFNQSFDMTPVPTPLPPAFTITKAANPSTNIGQSTPYEVTFTLHICNTGGGTFGNPVVINDNWNDAVDNWQFVGGDYTDINMGLIKASGSGKTATITFSEGFPDHTCYDYVYSVKMYSGEPTYCAVWHNIADLSYLAQPTKEATVTLTDYCPPPSNFTMVKSASKTTVTGPNESITFNMRLCNTGGAAWTGTMYLFDDWTSAPGDWQYEGPYYTGDPVTGIDYISTSSPGTDQRLYEIKFQQPGFTGCVDIPMYIKSTNNYGCGPWYNLARIQSYLGSPTIESTVNITNYCSPTFTPTSTRTITPTFTKTFTVTVTNTVVPPSATFTKTVTSTYTLTVTPTYTLTPQPVMDITKTANTGVATFGDIITYTLTYHNTGTVAANPVCIYDTVPAQITYINSSLAPTSGAPNLSWCIGNVNPGGSGTITWWGKITGYPFNPLYYMRIYLGEIPYIKGETIATYRKYLEGENYAFALCVLRE